MRGSRIVVVILLVGLSATAVAYYFRGARRDRMVRALASSDAGRSAAFHGLMQSNRLWGMAKEYAYDASKRSPGDSYLQAVTARGAIQHVVRARRVGWRNEVASPPSLFVFSESGQVVQIVENAAGYLVSRQRGAQRRGTVLMVVRDGERTEVRSVDESPRVLLERTGAFRLVTARGTVVIPEEESSREALPELRWDTAAGRLVEGR